MTLVDRGEVIDALPLLESAVDKPLRVFEKHEVYNYIGESYFQLGKLGKSSEAYSKSLEENPKQHNIWVSKGVALRNLDDLEGAEECYRRALAIKPSYAELHSSLGSLYIIKDEPAQAVKSFQKAIQLNPSLAVTHGNYALALGLTGDFEKADEELETAARQGYENVQIVRDRLEAMKMNQAQ